MAENHQVTMFRYITKEEFRVLTAVEMGMRRLTGGGGVLFGDPGTTGGGWVHFFLCPRGFFWIPGIFDP